MKEQVNKIMLKREKTVRKLETLEVVHTHTHTHTHTHGYFK